MLCSAPKSRRSAASRRCQCPRNGASPSFLLWNMCCHNLQEQAAALKSMGMSDYESLKARLLLTTALLTAGGSGLAAVTAGLDAAVPFAIGGLAGLIYQLLLQLGADAAVAQAAATSPGSLEGTGSGGNMGSGAGMSAAVTSFSAAAARSRGARVPAGTMTPQFLAEPVSQEDFQGRMLRVLGSSPFRLLVLSTAALFGIWLAQDGATTGEPPCNCLCCRAGTGCGFAGAHRVCVALLLSASSCRQPGRDDAASAPSGRLAAGPWPVRLFDGQGCSGGGGPDDARLLVCRTAPAQECFEEKCAVMRNNGCAG